jgi:hypothetical protein
MRLAPAFLLAIPFAVAALADPSPPGPAATKPAQAHADAAQIRTWVEQLAADDAQASQAVKNLKDAGQAAVPHLKTATETGSEKVRERARIILMHIEHRPDWEKRVLKLPEIWPGGDYVNYPAQKEGFTVRFKNERVKHEGRDVLRLSDTSPVKTKAGELALVTTTFLCEPDRHLTPIRITAEASEGLTDLPKTDLTFKDGRLTGVFDGKKVERELPRPFVIDALLMRFVALMPFVSGYAEWVYIVELSEEMKVYKALVSCHGRRGPFAYLEPRLKLRVIHVEDPEDRDNMEHFQLTEERIPQLVVWGSTPMSALIPADKVPTTKPDARDAEGPSTRPTRQQLPEP